MEWKVLKYILTLLPEFSFPMSHIVQICKNVEQKSAQCVSGYTFAGYLDISLEIWENTCFAEKYTDCRTIFFLCPHCGIGGCYCRFGGILQLRSRLYSDYRSLGSNIWSVWNVDNANWTERLFPYCSEGAGSDVFPISKPFQLQKITTSDNVKGVSLAGWILQIMANVVAYLLIDKPGNV